MKGWKTISLNAAVLAAAAVMKGAGWELPDLTPETVAAILAIINLILRLFTSTPAFKSE
jgi:hypothetical protein